MANDAKKLTGAFKPKVARMFTGVRRHQKFDIASGQLETAIRIFLTDGADMFSALTLAAAAGAILHTLVLNAGKQPFVDYIIEVNEYKAPTAPTPPRNKIIKHIHSILSINQMKHLDPGQETSVEFDAEEAALAAILKAVADFKTLTGESTASMKALLKWTYLNLDSTEIMGRYEAAKAEGKIPPDGNAKK